MPPKPESILSPLRAPKPGDPLKAVWGKEVVGRITELEGQETLAVLPYEAAPVHMAGITGAGAAAGYYTAITMYWDGTSWVEDVDGPVFEVSATGYGELREVNGNPAVETGRIVQVFPIENGVTGNVQWVFFPAGLAPGGELETVSVLYGRDESDPLVEGWLPANRKTLGLINDAVVSDPATVYARDGLDDEGWNETEDCECAVGPTGPAGTTDHGALTGLADDDHLQYHTDARGDVRYALLVHAARHQNGGADEISVAGLSGLLADDQNPTAHAADHQNGGSDEINVAGLSGELADNQPPKAHAARHQNGGADEISVAGLSGLLADDQNPTAHAADHVGADSIQNATVGQKGLATAAQITMLETHAARHQNGGADEINVAGLSGELADAQPPKAHTHTHVSTTGRTANDHHAQAHAADHQNGGSDEISVAGLSGELADDQPPKVHASYGSDHTPTHETAKAAPPTVNDDVDGGYGVGSFWFDTTNDKAYVCLDNTDGAAVWTETTSAAVGAHAPSHTDGTDQVANEYPGASGKTITAIANAQVDTAEKQFGTGSALFDGTDDRLNVTDDLTDFDFGSGQFTVECWVYRAANGSNDGIITKGGGVDAWNDTDGHQWVLFMASDNKIYFFWNTGGGGSSSISSNAVDLTDGFHHIAASQDAGNIRLFLDGTQVAVAGVATISEPTTRDKVRIGSFPSDNHEWPGWIDEVRISNTGRYSAGFTPSALPFVPDANTKFLMHADGVDASTTFTDATATGYAGLLSHEAQEISGVKTFNDRVNSPSHSIPTKRIECEVFTDSGINACLVELGADGGEVYLPEGTYTITGTITIPQNNITLRGAGKGTILDASAGQTFNVVDVNGKHYCTICDLQIIGKTGEAGNNYLIWDTQGHNLIVRGCYLNNADYACIGFSQADNASIQDNRFADCPIGITVFGFDIKITGNRFDSLTTYSIVANNSDASGLVSGNTFTASKGFYTIADYFTFENNYVQDATGVPCKVFIAEYVVIVGNVFEGTANTFDDVVIEDSNYIVVSNNVFHAVDGERAIYIDNSDYVVIEGNISTGHDTCGIEILATAAACSIGGNILLDATPIIDAGSGHQYRVYGDFKAGGITDYSEFEADGTLKANGNATTWDDVQFDIHSGRVPGANFPTWEIFTANTKAFAFAVNDFIDLKANEYSHTFKEGVAAHMHAHITIKTAQATGADRFVKLQVWLAYVNRSGDTWSESTLSAELTVPDGSSALEHFYLDLGDVDLSGYTIGTQMKARIKRIAATGGVEYADDIYITQVGAHLEQDTLGSRTETVK